MGDARLGNCELHNSNSTSNAFGTIENFMPYDGNLIFKEIHSQPITAIRQLPNEEAIYALRGDSGVIRVREYTADTSEIVSSIPGIPGKYLLEVVPKSSKVLFASRNDGTLNSFTSSCEGIYKTCQSIAWNDPLNCLYCANEDGSGTVVPDKTDCPNNNIYQNVCPPTILATTETENNTYSITGINLDKFLEEPKVTVCDTQCNLTSKVTPTTIHCFTGTHFNDPCIVKVKGALDSTYRNITLSKRYLRASALSTNDYSKNNFFILENVIFVITLICLLVSITIIYLCIYRQKTTRLERNDDIPLELISDILNPKDLVVLNTQPLGSGISATVYRGSYKTATGDYMPVAVKILNNKYAQLVHTAEFISELEVLRQVEHSNIVNFIGHTYIDRTLHIVTEYMAGGSLYDYILNDDTPLKYQDTFDYMDQILSAMVYLSEQQIVHRDLAARNCLLNHNHTVLKVSDFGLARSVDFKGEYQILHDIALPTRWIAIEAFSFRKFTEKTDVWSFGVLIWELFTRGATPYDPLDHFQIQDFLKTGQRLQCPEACPDQIYALMITCWDGELNKRPTFKQLQKDLKDRIRHLTNVNKQYIETGYERPNKRLLTNFEMNDAVCVSIK